MKKGACFDLFTQASSRKLVPSSFTFDRRCSVLPSLLLPLTQKPYSAEIAISVSPAIFSATLCPSCSICSNFARGSPNLLNRQRSTAQGKENVQLNQQRSTAQGKENVQVGEQSTPMRGNEITSQCSKKPNIVRNLTFDQREQLNCIQRVRKDPSLPSMPSSLNEGVFGDNCKRVMGSTCNQRVQNSLSATKRKEVGTSNFQPTIDLPKKQATKKLVQNQSLLPQGDRTEIEKLVDKVIEENPDTVKSFRNPRRREFAHCFLGGMAFLEGKKKVDKDLLSQILYEKLSATLLKQPAGCNSGVNIFQ